MLVLRLADGLRSLASVTLDEHDQRTYNPEGHYEALEPRSSVVLILAHAVPVAPALLCIAALTIVFFSIFLAAVIARLAKILSKTVGTMPTKMNSVEDYIAQAADAMCMAPMLCVLMILARLRATELDPATGEPVQWAKGCMYGATVALFARVVLQVIRFSHPRLPQEARDRSESGVWPAALCCVRVVCPLVLYGCVSAIIISLFVNGPRTSSERHPLSPAMACVVALTMTYFVESLAVEVSYEFKERRKAHKPEANGSKTQGSAELLTQAMSARPATTTEPQPSGAISGDAQDQVGSPRSIPMFCVLLVGIILRSVQLGLKPPYWACAAMIASTILIMGQAAYETTAYFIKPWSSAPPTLGPLSKASASEPDCAHAMEGGDAAAGAPSKTNEDRRLRQTLNTTITICNSAAIGLLHIGVALTLVSVFTMEVVAGGYSLDALVPDSEVTNHIRPVRPVSTAMRCVTLLTLIYFAVNLALAAWGLACIGSKHIHGQREQIFTGLRRSLAFAPMLCVMMVGVRLRAMQLKIRDPQLWAQQAMYVATFAVIVQVACSVVPLQGEDDEGPLGADGSHALGKLLAILVLTLRYVASALLYGAVAVLIFAVFIMDAPV